MKDRILSSYLKDFVDKFGLNTLDEATAFEHLSGHCIVSMQTPEPFESSEVIVGGSGDLGIDALGILVNDHLVQSELDVDHFRNSLHRLDVQFIFVQAKTSPHFDGDGIGTFISGVRQFFDSSIPQANADILSLHRTKEHIFDRSIDMESGPTCRLYYVTTGTWADDLTLLSRIKQGTEDLKATDLFSDVVFIPLDAAGLKRAYQELNQKITRKITFEKHTILPTISGVTEAYIGILPCLEYLTLICDDHGNLNRRLFHDNVRDFQGRNAVNMEIEATVQNKDQSDRFALLNNGVTIVARDANKVGATFRLRDYQIVNGCQTSHILHRNKEQLTQNTFLSVKLIVIGDAEVTNQIIQGTNRQTEVKVEAFESLAPFQKELEEFYRAEGQNRPKQIYYERRSKQYDNQSVRRDQIITLATQIKCFVAMFLNEPQSTHRYYGELLNSYRNRLFSDSHASILYFLAGVSLNTVEHLFASGTLPRELRRFKYQFLMVFRLINEPFDLPRLDEKSTDKCCQAILNILDDDSSCKAAFERAGEIIRSCQSNLPSRRDPVERTRAFTIALIEAASEQKDKGALSATASRLRGSVKRFSDTLGYGFITGDNGVDYFAHYSRITGQGFRSLVESQRVQFTPIQTDRGLQAIDVEVEC